MTKPIEQVSPFEPMAYRVRDVVGVLGVSKSTIYEMAANGELTFTKVGGRTLVTRAELQRLLDAGQRRAA
jgi:excisionase family DNA binding protein